MFSRTVSRVLNTFNINLAQVNPNGWKFLLCLSIIIGKYKVDLKGDNIRYMYCLKKNNLNKGRAYIFSVVENKLHLKLPDSTMRWKDKYFYIIGDFWGDEVEFLVRNTWNHNFNTNQPYASEIVNKLGPYGKGKIRRIKIQNIKGETYKDILIIAHLRGYGMYRDYTHEYTCCSSIER